MTSNQNSNIYYPQWTECHTVFDGKDMAYLFFDLGLYRMIPVVGKDDTLQILVNYKPSEEDGLPQKKDIDTFNCMGQVLNETLNKDFNISYIGYLASNSVCGFYFCIATSNGITQNIKLAMASFTEFEYNLYLLENDCWKAYTDCFFPAYQTSELIQNGMVAARLEKGGDTLVIPRPVYHGLRFRTQSDRENFITTVSSEGFRVVSCVEEKDLDNKEWPYHLEISRIDKVDRKTLSEYTSFLWNIAYGNYGLYEGWDTQGISG